MQFIFTNMVPILNIIGISFDIAGAFLVASEVVKKYRGDQFKGHASFSFDESSTIVPPPQKTAEFVEWELKKFRNMKLGLGSLVFGFSLQIIANILQFKWEFL